MQLFLSLSVSPSLPPPLHVPSLSLFAHCCTDKINGYQLKYYSEYCVNVNYHNFNEAKFSVLVAFIWSCIQLSELNNTTFNTFHTNLANLFYLCHNASSAILPNLLTATLANIIVYYPICRMIHFQHFFPLLFAARNGYFWLKEKYIIIMIFSPSLSPTARRPVHFQSKLYDFHYHFSAIEIVWRILFVCLLLHGCIVWWYELVKQTFTFCD